MTLDKKRGLVRIAKRVLPTRLRHTLERQLEAHRFGAAYLNKMNWFEGARSRTSVGSKGRPVPWITYPAFRMLDRAILPTHKIFEYGSGNSSLWWSSKANLVASVEHDPAWSADVSARSPGNVSVTLRQKDDPIPDGTQHLVNAFLSAHPYLPSLGDPTRDIHHGLNCADFGAYAVEPVKYGKGYFDIFVVDGMARSLCSHIATELIAENGFIIFDNSDRRQYNPAFEDLGRRGWKRIDFYGPGPVHHTEWCTSIFCRSLDWLPKDLSIPVGQMSDIGDEGASGASRRDSSITVKFSTTVSANAPTIMLRRLTRRSHNHLVHHRDVSLSGRAGLDRHVDNIGLGDGAARLRRDPAGRVRFLPKAVIGPPAPNSDYAPSVSR